MDSFRRRRFIWASICRRRRKKTAEAGTLLCHVASHVHAYVTDGKKSSKQTHILSIFTHMSNVHTFPSIGP